MERNDQKLHLWIPEKEIENVPKTPTGRRNDYGLDHATHGSSLSQGLQEILDIFQRLQAGDSLCGEDLITFQVILQDKEDFSNTKRFIEDEGLKINAVKDKRHAVVSAPRDAFRNLCNRVDRYRDDGIKKDFQYIAGFAPYRAEDKQAASLVKYYQEHPDELTVDIQMMLLPDMEPEMQMRVQEKITEKIKNQNGHLQGEPYQLTDGTIIIRAMVSMESLSYLSDDPGIYRVEQTTFFQHMTPSVVSSYADRLRLNPNVNLEQLPAVVVLDDGVNLPDGLAAASPVHWIATGCKKTARFGGHGTPVASRVLFQELGMHITETEFTPRARVIDAMVVDSQNTPSDVMLKRIREAVQVFSPIAKIFNFSYNAQKPIDGDEMSFLGCELDLLCRKYHIRFVISAGNHQLVFTEDSLRDIIEDDDSRIAEPADAMLGITVGAVVGVTHDGSASKSNEIAPYSRRGAGFCGFYKPDLVAYGATQFRNGYTPYDPYAVCLAHNGFCALSGTSFTAPTVAGDLAQVLSIVPDEDIGLAQALLYNGAVSLYDKTAVTQAEIDLAGNLYGRGLASPENSMYSSENKVSFVHAGTMNRLTKKRVKFHIPEAIAALKVKRGEKKIRVTVTCIAQPPVDRTKGSEYSAAYISASIHRLNSNGKNVVDNPTVCDNRNKWDTCYHFSNEFSSFGSGSWEVWLELFTRWGVADNDEIPYSLVITVEDLIEAGNLYSEIIRESQGRFMPAQNIRIPVR